MKREREQSDSLDPDDRISALPDSILGVILSFLPIKDAVATTILSKSWKLVSMTIDSLDFYHEGCSKQLPQGEDMKFISFVNGVLRLHDAGLLNKFSLAWNPTYISSSHANSWIDIATTRNVHELFLRVETPNGPYGLPKPFEMPISVFSCDSLQSLELNGYGVYVPDNIVVCLPRLETLKLVWVKFQSQETFENLISQCAMLKYLNLHMNILGVGQHNAFTFLISSTSLRRLELYFVYKCSLHLQAPSLEYFKLNGYVSEIFVQRSLSSLVEVDFRLQFSEYQFSRVDICNSIVAAVCAFDCVEALTLSADAVRVLSCATIRLSAEFTRLVKLVAEAYCCHCKALQDFIQNSENLEVVTIKKHFRYRCDRPHYPKWTIPVEVPRCLSNSLRNVVLDGYESLEDEREMMRYMLKHGSVLEVIKIFVDKDILDSTKLELVQEICKFPRMSPACEVILFRKVFW